MTGETADRSYLDYLPLHYRSNPFLGKFLRAFEDTLDELHEVIDGISRYARPLAVGGAEQAPAEFLDWLAGWVALSLRSDWSESVKRQFIYEAVDLYRMRGTKTGLERMLQIYLGDRVSIAIYDTKLDFGFTPPHHFFQVAVTLDSTEPELVRRTDEVTRAIIEQQKPVHTWYALQLRFPTMRLLSERLAREIKEEELILGKNTLLGTVTTTPG